MVRWMRFLVSFEGRVSRRAYLLCFVSPLLLIEIAVAALVPPLDFGYGFVVFGIAVAGYRGWSRMQGRWILRTAQVILSI